MKFKFSKPMEHVVLDKHFVEPVLQEDGGVIFQINKKVQAQCVSVAEEAIIDAIIKTAAEEGFTDLYLIDREFIISAIKNEIDRRKGEEK